MGKYLDGNGLSHFMGLLKSKLVPSGGSAGQVLAKASATDHDVGWVTHQYAAAPSAGGNANVTNAILYGTVDSTSTATAFTATVAGLTQLVDGTTVYLRNTVVTSAAGFTVNVNNLGAKKCYNNMTNATQDSTIFNIAYSMLFIYDSTLDSGNGGWWIYRGYDGNTNTIGYQVRTNSGNKTASDAGYRYRIWLTSADGSQWVPINTSTSTNATTVRTLNTRAIDPFGPIVYRSTNGTCAKNAGIGATGIWQQYTLTIGYSYMASGFSLTFPDSVYLKCTPNADGTATMNSIVQTLPSSKDGKIYIYLGTAYSATSMELEIFHPVYWHDGTGIRMWTGAEGGGSSVDPATAAPLMDGTAAVGSSAKYAREDHVHPTDTSRQATLVSGTNIKTVNGNSLLGSGDLTIGGGSFVQKTGDTMTGDLRVSNSDITKDVVPSSDKYKSNLIVSDSNDDQIGYFGALQQTSSKEGIQFGTSRAVNGSTVYHGCHVTINSSGSRSVYFDDAAAWRSGLGVPSTSSTPQLSAANVFTNTATYKSSTLDRDRASTVSTEASSNSYLKFTDKDNESIGYIKHREGTDGKMSMDIFMETETSGNVKTSNGLTMSVDKSGNRFISVTDPAAWREALDVPGLSTSNTFLNNNQIIKQTNVDTTEDDNGITGAVNRYWSILDKNDHYAMWVGMEANTSGRIRTSIGARNYGGGSQADNAVYLDVANDGTRSVGFSSGGKAAWQTALGLNTWTTVAIGDFATAASGWAFSASNCNIQYNAALGAVRARIQVAPTAAQTAGQKTIFTVKTAYRPKTFAASLSSLTSYAQAGQIYTSGGFAVNIIATPTGTNLYFNGVYFIGA